MTERAKKVSELTALTANTLAAGDLFMVVDVSASETKRVTANNAGLFFTRFVPGPYEDDTAASAAGIAVGSMYYKSTGAVVVRIA